MAEVSGKRTRKIGIGTGLDILQGLLSGLGLPSADIAAQFSSARQVSFALADVNRLWIDPGLLGRNLEGRRVSPRGSATGLYFGDQPWDLLVVESAIMSDRFTIRVERSRGTRAKLDVKAIEDLVGKASAKASANVTSSFSVTFAGSRPLTFAFSCVRLFLEPDGRIGLVNPQDTFLNAAVASGDIVYIPDRVRLSPDPAMIGLDKLASPDVGSDA
jgi:hypothetical protein